MRRSRVDRYPARPSDSCRRPGKRSGGVAVLPARPRAAIAAALDGQRGSSTPESSTGGRSSISQASAWMLELRGFSTSAAMIPRPVAYVMIGLREASATPRWTTRSSSTVLVGPRPADSIRERTRGKQQHDALRWCRARRRAARRNGHHDRPVAAGCCARHLAGRGAELAPRVVTRKVQRGNPRVGDDGVSPGRRARKCRRHRDRHSSGGAEGARLPSDLGRRLEIRPWNERTDRRGQGGRRGTGSADPVDVARRSLDVRRLRRDAHDGGPLPGHQDLASEIADAIVGAGKALDVFAAAALGAAPRSMPRSAIPAWSIPMPTTAGRPLHLAAFFGRREAAERLLAAGAALSARSTNSMSNTPLHAAVAGGRTDVALLLIQRGAEVNAVDSGHAAAHRRRERERGSRRVVARTAPMRTPWTPRTRRPCPRAAARNHSTIVDLINARA